MADDVTVVVKVNGIPDRERSLDPGEVVWVTGKDVFADRLTKYPNGTLVVTFKRKPDAS